MERDKTKVGRDKATWHVISTTHILVILTWYLLVYTSIKLGYVLKRYGYQPKIISEIFEMVELSEIWPGWGCCGPGGGGLRWTEGILKAVVEGASVKGMPTELVADRGIPNAGTRLSLPGVAGSPLGAEPGVAGAAPVRGISEGPSVAGDD
jgi:hypothetical protein